MPELALETVDYTIEDRVAWITWNRPEALNAWTKQLGRDTIAAIDDAEANPDVRAIVLTGTGRGFSSGADLRSGEGVGPDGKPDVATPLRTVYNPLLMRIRTVAMPIIAAVNGPAVGIACSAALACDMAIAVEEAYFLMAFVNIGLSLDGGASMLLPRLAGHARAFEIAYTGDRIPAAKALEWGLINQVVAADQLRAAAGALAARFAAGPPGAYAAIKRLINASDYADFEAQLEAETVEQQQRSESKDFVEGVMAFMQKRPANFTGE